MAVSAAVCCNILTGGERAATEYASPLILGFLAALVIGMLIGSFNGFLVAKLKIQPMVATLIMFTAGRGIAQLITDGQITYVRVESYQDPGKLPPTCASTDTVYCGYAHGTPDGTAFKKDGAGTVHSVGRHQRKGLQAGRN